MRSAPRSIRRSDATTRRSRPAKRALAVMLTSVRWQPSQGSTASAGSWTRRSAGSVRRRVATAAPRRFRWRSWSSNAASCGWSTTISPVPATGAMRRSAGFRPTSPRRATSPSSTLRWGTRRAAIARLRPLALASDDPDYATQLARILGDAGHAEEAQAWRGKAAARYDELLARHRDAFADHAAEFWLTIGGDPRRALRLARQNLSLRQTPRARALVRRARAARRGAPAGGTASPRRHVLSTHPEQQKGESQWLV